MKIYTKASHVAGTLQDQGQIVVLPLTHAGRLATHRRSSEQVSIEVAAQTVSKYVLSWDEDEGAWDAPYIPHKGDVNGWRVLRYALIVGQHRQGAVILARREDRYVVSRIWADWFAGEYRWDDEWEHGSYCHSFVDACAVFHEKRRANRA